MVSDLFEEVDKLLEDSEGFWEIELTDDLLEALREGYADGLRGAALYIGELSGVQVGVTFDVVDPDVLEFLESRGAEMVRNISKGTRHYLRSMIYNGVKEGIPEQDLIDGIFENLFQRSDFSEQRVRSITRFEIARAQTAGWEKQMDEVGLEHKRWVTIGADACIVCKGNEAMDPQPVDSKPYDNVFGEKVGGPPAHPNL